MSTLTAAQIKAIKSMIQLDIHSRSNVRKGLATELKASKTLTKAQEKFPNLDGIIDLATIKKLIKEVKEDMENKIPEGDELNPVRYDDGSKKRKKRASGAVISGKFSQIESDLIERKIMEYCTSADLQIHDVIIGLRDVDAPNKKKETHSIWAELAEALPTRNPKAIYQHANRRFTMKQKEPWTPEAKEHLKQLVKEKGNKWSEIGRIMGKLGDDCKHVYRRFRERVKKGRFSEEEDAELTQAIKKVLNFPYDYPNEDLPSIDISWTAVAKEMNEERLDIDYLRRWQTVKSSFVVADMQSDILVSSEPLKKKKVHIYSNSKGNDVAYKIVRHLGAKGDNHESQIVWADIDRLFNLPYAFAAHKWKFLQSELTPELKGAAFQQRVQFFISKYEKLVDPSVVNSGSSFHGSSSNAGMADDDDTSDEEEPKPKAKKSKK